MLTIRAAEDRGHVNHGWLDSHHSFSFANYYDPAHMGVSVLRVINEDRVEPGQGFGTHGHANMEIVSYVLSGALQHRDSLGNGSVIRSGEVQRMSAGTGVRHSEYNASREEPVHFLQIWLLPNRQDVAPGYAQKYFDPAERRGRLRLLVSPDGREGSIDANSDALLYGALLEAGERVCHTAGAQRQTYVHVAQGRVEVNGVALVGGDGVRVDRGEAVGIVGVDAAEVLLFDLP